MPVKSYKVGPGLLTFGAAGTLKDFTAQVTDCAIEWSEDVEDSVPTLDGGELAGEATYSATLNATVVQDVTDGGMVEWTWTEKGKLFPFTYTPNNDEDASFSGTVRVAPLNVGGKVKSKPTSDLEWTCIGEPVMSHSLV
jgi:hypothetical protein